MSFVCFFCKSEFKLKANLKRHIDTNKKCLSVRTQNKDIQIEKLLNENTHLQYIIQNLNSKIEILEKENKERFDQLLSQNNLTKNKISNTINTSNNINVGNTTNNTQNIINMKIDQLPLMNDFIPSVLTHPNIQEKLSTLTTKETFSKFIGTILNNHILLTDKSRAKAVYRELNQDGQIERKKNNIPQIITSQISKNNLLQEYIETTFAKVFEETDFSDQDSATYASNLGFLKNSITKITQEKIPDKRFVDPIVEHVQFIGKVLKDTSTVEPIQQLENTNQQEI